MDPIFSILLTIEFICYFYSWKSIQQNITRCSFVISYFKEKHVVLLNFLWEKINYLTYIVKTQFTSFSQMSFNWYEFHMVLDNLGHPVYAVISIVFTVVFIYPIKPKLVFNQNFPGNWIKTPKLKSNDLTLKWIILMGNEYYLGSLHKYNSFKST